MKTAAVNGSVSIKSKEELEESPKTGFLDSRREAFEAHVAARQLTLNAKVANVLQELGAPNVLTLELGCGHGHFLASFAAEHPEEPCFGIDFSRNRIRRAVRKQEHGKLENLRFLCAEIRESFDAMPWDVRFARVFVLYPDPWPKRRHSKYRLLSGQFLEELANRCVGGCPLFFRTDCKEYYKQTQETIEHSELWEIAPNRPWDHQCPTVFQARTGRSRSLIAIRRE